MLVGTTNHFLPPDAASTTINNGEDLTIKQSENGQLVGLVPAEKDRPRRDAEVTEKGHHHHLLGIFGKSNDAAHIALWHLLPLSRYYCYASVRF